MSNRKLSSSNFLQSFYKSKENMKQSNTLQRVKAHKDAFSEPKGYMSKMS